MSKSEEERSFHRIKKRWGKQVDGGIDISLNPRPDALRKDNPAMLSQLIIGKHKPGLFKSSFKVAQVSDAGSHRESAIFDVKLRFLEILSQKIWDGGRALSFTTHPRRLV